jgi:hypothetical protein
MVNKGCDKPLVRVKEIMSEYEAYVRRGGVMSEEDMARSSWLE